MAKPFATIGGVRVTHPDRVLWPEGPGLTKRDLARHLEAVAPWMIPHVEGRPLTLVRCPRSIAECHFMKHSKVWAPEALRRVRIPEKTKLGEYMVADSAAALVSLAQMDVVEIHTWNSRVERLEHPDRVVFDLDPGPQVPWREVVESARLLRDGLAGIGLRSFVKTTGGVGLHMVVPLAPVHEWKTCLEFARAVARAIERHDPARHTTALPRAGRERKILLDYLRNNRTNTSVAAFSPRARPRAPVSVPIAWDELSPRVPSDRWTMTTVMRRLARLGSDPWEGYWTTAQRLPGTESAARALD